MSACYVCTAAKSAPFKRHGIPMCGPCHYQFEQRAERERRVIPTPRVTAPMPQHGPTTWNPFEGWYPT